MFYWAPVSINNVQAQTFSQENKPDAIYGLATMTEYRLVSDLPLILRPDENQKPKKKEKILDWGTRLEPLGGTPDIK